MQNNVGQQTLCYHTDHTHKSYLLGLLYDIGYCILVFGVAAANSASDLATETS